MLILEAIEKDYNIKFSEEDVKEFKTTLLTLIIVEEMIGKSYISDYNRSLILNKLIAKMIQKAIKIKFS